MMGIVNNLLLSFVESQKGDKGRKAVLAKAGMPDNVWSSELVYPEEEFQKLLGATLEELGADAATGQKVFARYCGEALVKRFPVFWKSATDTLSFIKKVPKIHRDLPASVSEELPEKLVVIEEGDDTIKLIYKSPNHLCLFLRGLAEFVMEHYGEKGEITETFCTSQGADHCEFVVHILRN